MILLGGSLTFYEGTSLFSFSIRNGSKISSVIVDNQPTIYRKKFNASRSHNDLWTALLHDSRFPQKHQVFRREKLLSRGTYQDF